MIKKSVICFFIALCACFSLAGCGGTSLQKEAKNLSNYTINAHFDTDTKVLSATQTVEYINSSADNLSFVDFHLYPNAFSPEAKNKPVSLSNTQKAYPNGMDYGKIDISKVSVNGEDLQINVGGEDNTILQVDLQEEVCPNDRVKIYLEYVVLLPNVIHRFGYGDNTYNFGNFFPVACVYEEGEFMTKPYNSNGDPFYSDMANFDVTITTDSDMTLASTGEQKQTSVQDNLTTTNIQALAVRDFAFVLGKDLQVVSSQVGKTKVMYYSFSDKQAQQSLETSVKSLQTFNEMFGEYPYSTLSVVEANFLHGGMEYPNLVLISNSVDVYSEYTNVIIHEIAHQWWYGLVGNNEFAEGWLDEGLTEFSTLMFYEQNAEYEVDLKESVSSSLSSYLLFVDVYTSVYGEIDTSMNRALDEYKSEVEYVYVAYVKGVLFFDNLRDVLGKDMFLKCLKNYFSEYKFQNVSVEDMISSFEKTSKRSLGSFFDSWITGKVVLKSC